MKNLLLSSFIIAALTISSCSKDDSNDPVAITCNDGIQNGTETGIDCGGSCEPCEVQAEKDGIISSQDDPDLDTSDLKGDVTANVTLTSNTVWILSGPLSVKAGATLSIEPGTTIKAVAGGTNVYVVVEQGAKINAEGTANAPITFTSNAENPRSGDWGGILLLGKAPLSGGGTATTEVVDLTYGGTEINDNSGVMKYVEASYTGARINGDKEFNGITFYGVGNETVIENLAVFYCDDDAYEWFGGTVNVKNLIAVNIKDDMFDWTQGWNGTATNLYGLRESSFTSITEDPRGLEGDGNLDGNSPGDTGQSNPTIDGLVLINGSIIEMADMIKVRRGSGLTLTNAYVAFANEDAKASDFIDLQDRKGDANGSNISISIIGDAATGLDIADIKTTNNAVIDVTDASVPTVSRTIFDWTGYSFE
ncbi:hypothetical protein [Aequorivita marina]|uniref:hypothetical protein n=1 Tax=Aequorivita marina TaxID=3073654 RepID=UPI0028741FDA|nr:hypothetical protein [Aequorivita sp. S2608]MDS1297390.1 hypothetical protein [Aequorivita sp. S2608]